MGVRCLSREYGLWFYIDIREWGFGEREGSIRPQRFRKREFKHIMCLDRKIDIKKESRFKGLGR